MENTIINIGFKKMNISKKDPISRIQKDEYYGERQDTIGSRKMNIREKDKIQ